MKKRQDVIRQSKKGDVWLLVSAISLIAIGLLMVYSASIVISMRQYGHPFHYLWHQLAYLSLGLIAGAFIYYYVSMEKLAYYSPVFLLFTFVALILVLIPGLGREVNGSSRWLGIGGLGIQVSELAKLFTVLYLSGYINRHIDEVRYALSGFIKPVTVLAVLAILLLLEPDFGSTVVLGSTVLGMLFLAGVRWRIFLTAGMAVFIIFAALAISSPYRFARLTTFVHPWAHAFGSGYQLTQSLIAFGRGGLTGVGLGNSIQKWFYLPEAYTDFLFAVLAEECGLIGIVVVVSLFSILVFRGMQIGRVAFQKQAYFNAYVAYGFSLWIGLQAFINMGVNAGLLPTKGLTLPLMSYGGSSLSVMCMVLAILLRIDIENKQR